MGCEILNFAKPAALAREGLGIVGNAQHATATALRGMIPSVMLVVSPSLSTHSAWRG